MLTGVLTRLVAFTDAGTLLTNYMTDIVADWRSRITASVADPRRKGFMATAKMTNQFFAGSFGAMWEESFRANHLGGMPAPKFKVTQNKAFEMVSIMGPTVMWDYPGRVIKSLPKLDLPLEALGPELGQFFEAEQESHRASQEVRNKLMERYLNYSQREQPGGGLIRNSHRAIIDAIVKGRGCLAIEPYSFPGSDRKLTKCEYFDVEDLFVDPECRNSDLSDCKWVARRHRDYYWEVERRFNLPTGSLRFKATRESKDSASVHSSTAHDPLRAAGQTNDIVVWYEVFSMAGVGSRYLELRPGLASAFEEVVGDYAYLAICPGVNYALNFPPSFAMQATDDEARDAFEWPTPFYRDGRWPFALLDFHEVPTSPWPLAPMAMGLGELVVMNVIMSCLADRAYEACRTTLVASKSLGDEVLDRLKSSDYSSLVEVDSSIVEKINEAIQYIQSPEIRGDILAVYSLVADNFNKVTGLSDLLYGLNPGNKVSRSAADINIKNDAVNVRPEWMLRQAERWQTEAANLERICAGWHVRGEDLTPLLGKVGAGLWDELIANEDPEVYVREMRATLEANSIKKPNKFRDNQNIQQTTGYILPVLQWYMQTTGDTGPYNRYIKSIANAMDQDSEPWELPSLPQEEPDQEAMAAQQQAEALKQAAAEESLRGKQLRNTKLEREVEEADPPVPSPEAFDPSMLGPEMLPEMAGLPPIPDEMGPEPIPPEILESIPSPGF